MRNVAIGIPNGADNLFLCIKLPIPAVVEQFTAPYLSRKDRLS